MGAVHIYAVGTPEVHAAAGEAGIPVTAKVLNGRGNLCFFQREGPEPFTQEEQEFLRQQGAMIASLLQLQDAKELAGW